MQNPAIVERAKRTIDRTGLPIASEDPFDERDLAAIANDIFLLCALKTAPICGVRLEFFLTQLRLALLRLACADTGATAISEQVLDLFCALAQQCLINEYVFAQTDKEAQNASRLREELLQKLSTATAIPPILLAAVAAYFPLYSVPGAQSLPALDWPDCVADLLRRQITEPLQEAEDRRTIPALTDIDDASSIAVMRQYEESPYPRWTVTARANPPAVFSAGVKNHGADLAEGHSHAGEEILIAACGTGRHAFYVAQQSPQARILAIDLSRPSLAYARKMTEQAGLANIEYAQADILRLATIGRTFDRIEAIGVLHHLADPKAGLRVLLALLRPKGIMRLGLYSEAARRLIVEARALIAERGYAATPEGIRALRRAIMCSPHRQRWEPLLSTSADFYSTSGCRDLFFNVMEHRFTIPQIAALLDEHGLFFLGFELDPATVAVFRRKHPDAGALNNLAYWHDFETANPDTFRRMYVFSVSRGCGPDPTSRNPGSWG